MFSSDIFISFGLKGNNSVVNTEKKPIIIGKAVEPLKEARVKALR